MEIGTDAEASTCSACFLIPSRTTSSRVAPPSQRTGLSHVNHPSGNTLQAILAELLLSDVLASHMTLTCRVSIKLTSMEGSVQF